MLFNLTERRYFPINNNSSEAVAINIEKGPCFGFEELVAEEPYNLEKQCVSYVNREAYKIAETRGG